MPTTVTSSIGTTGRDYSTLQAWEDACPANLVTADQVWRGECYNDSEFSAAVLISGITSDSTRYLDLTAATGQSFQDHANVRTNALRYNQSNGVGLAVSSLYGTLINTQVSYTRISRLQVKNTAANGRTVMDLSFGSVGQTWRDLILESARPNATDYPAGGGIGLTVINCVSINLDSSGTGCGFVSYNLGGDGVFLGCTIVRPSDLTIGGTGILRSYGAPVLQSCAVFGFTDPVQASGSWGASSKNNATDAASGLPGSSNQHSVTYSQSTPFTDADKDSLDLRAIAATSLITNGFYDGASAPNDISATPRADPPTIGAWEVVAAVAVSLLWGVAVSWGESR